MPAHHQGGSQLAAVLSFYSSIVTVNAEGDSLVSEETLEGLGTTGFLLQSLFGSLLKVANPELANSARAPPTTRPISPSEPTSPTSVLETETQNNMGAAASTATATTTYRQHSPVAAILDQETNGASEKLVPPIKGLKQPDIAHLSTIPDIQDSQEAEEAVKQKLTDLLPDAGYFLAGAVSGGVSRTATAPLDRLKVYLLVNTKASPTVAAQLVKQGHPIVALRNAGGPITEAVRTLWNAGGIRTFFAGEKYRRRSTPATSR